MSLVTFQICGQDVSRVTGDQGVSFRSISIPEAVMNDYQVPPFSNRLPNHVTTASIGANFCMILLDDGSVFSMGFNDYDQLGVDQISVSNTFKTGEVLQLKSFTRPVKNLVCGAHYSLFVMDNEDLFGCGSNDYGQLSFSEEVNVTLPKEINYGKKPGDRM